MNTRPTTPTVNVSLSKPQLALLSRGLTVLREQIDRNGNPSATMLNKFDRLTNLLGIASAMA